MESCFPFKNCFKRGKKKKNENANNKKNEHETLKENEQNNNKEKERFKEESNQKKNEHEQLKQMSQKKNAWSNSVVDTTLVSPEWEKIRVVRGDGRATVEAQILFARFDQFNRKVQGQGACSVLSLSFASWMAFNGDSIFSKEIFNDLIVRGAREWQRMCPAYKSVFRDGHFDLETALTARTSQVVANRSKSFTGTLKSDYYKGEFETGMMGLDEIWAGISEVVERSSGPVYYVVLWKDHFFLLRADKTEYCIVETDGRKLNDRAHIIRFGESSRIEEKGAEPINGKECCRVYMQRFIVDSFFCDKAGVGDGWSFQDYLKRMQVDFTCVEPAQAVPLIIHNKPAVPAQPVPLLINNRPTKPAQPLVVRPAKPTTQPLVVRPAKPTTQPLVVRPAKPTTHPLVVVNKPANPATQTVVVVKRPSIEEKVNGDLHLVTSSSSLSRESRPEEHHGKNEESRPEEHHRTNEERRPEEHHHGTNEESHPEEHHGTNVTSGNKIGVLLKSTTILKMVLVLCFYLLLMVKSASLIRAFQVNNQCEWPSPQADSVHRGVHVVEMPREEERTGDVHSTVNGGGGGGEVTDRLAIELALQGGAYLHRIDDDGTTNGDFDGEEEEDSDTLTSSGSNFMEQHGHFCYTCDYTVSKSCCSVRARVFHKGHRLIMDYTEGRPKRRVLYSRSSRFICDCGAGGARATSSQYSKPRKFTDQSRSCSVPVPGTYTRFPSWLLYAIEDVDEYVDSGSDLVDDVAGDGTDRSCKLSLPKEFHIELAQIWDRISYANDSFLLKKKAFKSGSMDLKMKSDYPNSRELKSHLSSGSLTRSLLSVSARGKLALGEGDEILYRYEVSMKGDVGAKTLTDAVHIQGKRIRLYFSSTYRLLFVAYQDGTSLLGWLDSHSKTLIDISFMFINQEEKAEKRSAALIFQVESVPASERATTGDLQFLSVLVMCCLESRDL